MAGSEARAGVTDRRHGSRTRSLTGAFGPIEIALPRLGKDWQTHQKARAAAPDNVLVSAAAVQERRDATSPKIGAARCNVVVSAAVLRSVSVSLKNLAM